MSRPLPILLVLALLLAACSFGGATASTAIADDPGTSETSTTDDQVEKDGTTTSTGGPTTTTAAVPVVTEPDLADLDGLSPTVRSQLEDLIRATQEIRELPFLSPPKITVVNDAELEARVRAEIEEEAEDFPADEALYKLLGLLEAEADLETLLVDLYGEQVAGFYDGETGEIVVPARSDGLSVLQQGTMVHELVHAITDQHFGFDAQFQEMIDEERLDEAGAYQALIEGDASLAEVLWVQSLPQEDLGRFIAESLQIDRSAFDAAPQFITDSLIFPYDTGLAFVQDLQVTGGWAAVNDAYSAFPVLPGSTEQVITPSDYGRDLPATVDLPSIDIVGYELERTSVWGEEGLRVMLDQAFSGSVAAEAADGWGGDAYHQWFDGENAAFLLVYEGDTERDLEQLRSTLLDYARSNVAEEDFVWVDEEGGLLYFIAADDPVVGELIRVDLELG